MNDEDTRMAGNARPDILASSSLTSVWDFVLQIITTTEDICKYGARPETLAPSPIRQIFVERPAVRRKPGGDRWRHSGGKRGSTSLWLDDHTGLRKRYGKVVRVTGRSLKFWSFTLLRRPEEHEDRTTVVFVVEADQDPASLRSVVASPRAETSPPSRDLDPAQTQLAGAIPTIDFSASECTEAFSQLPRRLPERDAAIRRSGPPGNTLPPSTQEVAAIDARVALSFHEYTGSVTNRSSTVSCPPDFTGFYTESDDDGAFIEQFNYLGSLEDCTDATDTGPWDDWDTVSTASSLSQRGTPPFSVKDSVEYTDQLSKPNVLQQSSAAALLDWDCPQSSAQQHKRKQAHVRLDIARTSEAKRACSRPMASFAVLGLCAVLGSFGLQAGTGGFAPYAVDNGERCAAGPAEIANAAMGGSMCPEGTPGSQCPYECLGGFTASGLHMCMREASGRFRYTGGECAPSSPCQGGVTLVDSGDLTLWLDSAHHQCQWDLVCTGHSLAPTLRFASFSMGNGDLSVYGGTHSEQMGPTAHETGPNSPRFADLRDQYGGHLWQRKHPNVSSPDVIVLRGDDPWWISQKPIRVAPTRTASVLYKAKTNHSAMPDSFTASFSCAPFEELCTATDTMELDWVTVVHRPPAGFRYPQQVAQFVTVFEQMGWPPATSACASRPCVHGTCVDSDSQQAYSEETAFSFVCNCYQSWSGELCDEEALDTEQLRTACTAMENDCDDAVSSCAVLGPGQHECICFPGFGNGERGEPPRLTGKGVMATNRCKLEIEDPPVGSSWVSGPGYEAVDGIIIGSFEATVGESPAHLQVSTLLESSAFFDPAAFNQVLLNAPPRADGCSIDAYESPGPAAVDMETLMILSSDGGCPLWLKVIIAQRMAAKGVIIYGDGMPEGSAISWAIDNPARLAKAINDPYDVGATAQQLGLACVVSALVNYYEPLNFTSTFWNLASQLLSRLMIRLSVDRQMLPLLLVYSLQVPTIFVGQKQGEILRRAALGGLTWFELHCGRAQLIEDRPGNLSPPMQWPPEEVCASNPCQNGGTCTSGADPTALHRSGTMYVFSEFTCDCPGGFTGEHCENSPGQSSCVDDPTWRNMVTGAGCEEYEPTQWCDNCSTVLIDNNCIIDQGQVGPNDEATLAIEPINRVAYAWEACPASCGICKAI